MAPHGSDAQLTTAAVVLRGDTFRAPTTREQPRYNGGRIGCVDDAGAVHRQQLALRSAVTMLVEPLEASGYEVLLTALVYPCTANELLAGWLKPRLLLLEEVSRSGSAQLSTAATALEHAMRGASTRLKQPPSVYVLARADITYLLPLPITDEGTLSTTVAHLYPPVPQRVMLSQCSPHRRAGRARDRSEPGECDPSQIDDHLFAVGAQTHARMVSLLRQAGLQLSDMHGLHLRLEAAGVPTRALFPGEAKPAGALRAFVDCYRWPNTERAACAVPPSSTQVLRYSAK